MVKASAARDPSGQAQARISRGEGGAVVVVFSGEWTRAAAVPPIEPLFAEIASTMAAGSATGPLRLEGRDLGRWDSRFLVALRKLQTVAQSRGLAVDLSGLPSGAARLLDLAARVPPPEPFGPPAEPADLSLRVGLATRGAVRSALGSVEFLGATALAFWQMLMGRARFRLADLLAIIEGCSTRALPIVSLIAVLIGLIMAFVGAVQLRKFGAAIYVADLVSIAMLREMGAVMTAIIMAGRTGAAFAAELGTMQVNEEIDALSTFGIDPIGYLVLPRVLALVLMMPLLCLYADIMGILGGALIGVTLLDLPFVEYWNQTVRSLSLTHLAIGLVKAAVFGALVGLAGCLRGMASGRSAAAVGSATTSAVVTAIVLIITVDGLFAVILDFLGL